MTGPGRKLYHATLAGVMRLAGLDFNWYVDFYRKWPHAIPALEPVLQKLRPASRSWRFFSGYDIGRFAKPPETVLDIGANVGDVSSHLLRLGYTVHAFEPDPRCAEFLRRRFSRLDTRRFHLHEVAVSNYDGTTELYFGSRTTESSSILRDKPGTLGSSAHEVDVRSIESVLESVGYAGLIMMDIEGAEYEVLEEMLKPERLDRFGLCVAESHAHKIPGLEAAHRRILSLIERLDLGERVRLDWR